MSRSSLLESVRVNADPLGLFAALRPLGFSVLLHTPDGSGWSYLVRPNGISTASYGESALGGGARFADDEPPFRSGEIVILSYDHGRRFERLPDANPDFVAWPETIRIRAGTIVARREDGRVRIFGEDRDAAERVIAEAQARTSAFRIGRWNDLASDAAYEAMAARAKEYIAAGDVYQVNLARWFEAEFDGDALGLFAHLTRRNPSPYSAYIELPALGDIPATAVVSSSPELLFRVAGDRIVTRPIAGTYPRAESSESLPCDPKERAEHIMLIDLERNDLGRVAEIGSVRMEELLAVERYSHLHHIVSQVSARLRAGTTLPEILRAIFPGGTITGCPKVRAMEIIDELESCRRGLYTGSIGFVDDRGDAVFNIAIRTAIVRGGRIRLAAGAGIVADSDPAREARETRVKAAAFLEAGGAGDRQE